MQCAGARCGGESRKACVCVCVVRREEVLCSVCAAACAKGVCRQARGKKFLSAEVSTRHREGACLMLPASQPHACAQAARAC